MCRRASLRCRAQHLGFCGAPTSSRPSGKRLPLARGRLTPGRLHTLRRAFAACSAHRVLPCTHAFGRGRTSHFGTTGPQIGPRGPYCGPPSAAYGTGLMFCRVVVSGPVVLRVVLPVSVLDASAASAPGVAVCVLGVDIFRSIACFELAIVMYDACDAYTPPGAVWGAGHRPIIFTCQRFEPFGPM